MKMKLREMEDTNRTPGWHARSTEYSCQAWAPTKEEAIEALRSLVADKVGNIDALLKAAGLPERLGPPCSEYWEGETEYDFQDEDGETWVDFSEEAWKRLDPVRWTQTEGARELPPTKVEYVLRDEDDYWIWESAYVANLETFTETSKFVPGVGIVYVCEATYTYDRSWTSKAKQWKL